MMVCQSRCSSPVWSGWALHSPATGPHSQEGRRGSLHPWPPVQTRRSPWWGRWRRAAGCQRWWWTRPAASTKRKMSHSVNTTYKWNAWMVCSGDIQEHPGPWDTLRDLSLRPVCTPYGPSPSPSPEKTRHWVTLVLMSSRGIWCMM